MFVERARAILPSFATTGEALPAIMEICKLVDGMPLGIELAAAKTAVLPVWQIVARLRDSFQLLDGTYTPFSHHQTLEATIQWSFDLLSEEERVLLQRLSVFSGGWTLDAAEAVASDETLIPDSNVLNLLSQLVNKSLVVVDLQSQAEARYGLLRVVRQYCHERLMGPGKAEATQHSHFDHHLGLVRQASSGLMTAQSPYWLKRLDSEPDNFREAVANGIALQRHTDTLELAAGLFWFWQSRGHITEGRAQLEKVLASGSAAGNETAARARALWAAGSLAWIQADFVMARRRLEESVAIWRQLHPADKLGLAISLRELGIIATYQGDLKSAHSALDKSIQVLKQADETWNLGLAYYNHGLVHEGECERVRATPRHGP